MCVCVCVRVCALDGARVNGVHQVLHVVAAPCVHRVCVCMRARTCVNDGACADDGARVDGVHQVLHVVAAPCVHKRQTEHLA